QGLRAYRTAHRQVRPLPPRRRRRVDRGPGGRLMGRPPLALGTHGEVRCYKREDGKYRARTKYRDYDGRVRHIERVGTSKTGAKNILKQAIRDRSRAATGDEITANTKLEVLARVWLRGLDESDKALRTKQTYRESWDRDLAGPVGGLRVGELTVSAADRVLRAIHTNSGSGSAQHAKVVLGGMVALAVRHDAVSTNPVREVVLPKNTANRKREPKTVLTTTELPGLRVHLRASEKATRRALPDVIDMPSALGCRIGELLALDWDKVDLGQGTIRIEGT